MQIQVQAEDRPSGSPALPAEIVATRARELDTRTGACPSSRCRPRCRLISHAPAERSARPTSRCPSARYGRTEGRLHSFGRFLEPAFMVDAFQHPLVGETGIEPVTVGLSVRCSTQLSYSRSSTPRRSEAVHGTRIVDTCADDQRQTADVAEVRCVSRQKKNPAGRSRRRGDGNLIDQMLVTRRRTRSPWIAILSRLWVGYISCARCFSLRSPSSQYSRRRAGRVGNNITGLESVK